MPYLLKSGQEAPYALDGEILTELAALNIVGEFCTVDETCTVLGFVKLFAVDAVATVALVSLHEANAMLRVSSMSSSQGS